MATHCAFRLLFRSAALGAIALIALGPMPAAAQGGEAAKPVPVTIENFVRAESDLYFSKATFGRLRHVRQIAPIDRQEIVRMNRDTLYSSGVFDLEAAPLTITLPDPGGRFMSMQVIDEDHYTIEVVYAPGAFTYTRDKVDTRYVIIIIRTLADPQKPDDLEAAHALQDKVKVEQASIGRLEFPSWDQASQDRLRAILREIAKRHTGGAGVPFGTRNEVDPRAHLVGTAVGWGGSPRRAAIYRNVYPKANDGSTVYRLTVSDVPVDGFWSISVYDRDGFFEKNVLGAYSVNSLTAKPGANGAFTIQFGDCHRDTPNCLPIMPGWNYTVRLYRPRSEILDGSWKFPEAAPVN